MKKLLLLSIASTLTFGAFAQQQQDVAETLMKNSIPTEKYSFETPTSGAKTTKTTAVGDTLFFHANQEKTQGPFLNLNADYAQPFDSGKVYGISVLGLKSFAQLYKYSSINADATKDTTYRIVGIYSRWHGRVGGSSTMQITFNVWDRGTNQVQANPNRPNLFIYGPPSSVKATVSGTAPNIAGQSIANNGAAVITPLSSPLTGVNYDVYVGYTMSYTWGSTGTDTFGLRSTQNGTTNIIEQINGSDSLVAFNNLVQSASNTWQSPLASVGITNGGDQVILPVIQRECPTCWPSSVSGVTNKSLTFHGNYPNPAVGYTDVIFSLDEVADITIDIVDMSGRTVQTIKNTNLNKGENSIRIETNQLASGNYVYAIQSSKGGSVASQFTVAK